MKKLILLSTIIFASKAFAQNPFESIGKTTKPMLSLSNGKYIEHFENDSIRQIGSVMVNMRTDQIVAFVNRKEQAKKVHSQTSSRFLSVDPLARQFPFYTPYQYAANSPIAAIDLDGMESFVANKNENSNSIILTLLNAEDELSVVWSEKDKETNTDPLMISEVQKFVYNVKVDKNTGIISIPESNSNYPQDFKYTKFQKEADGAFKKDAQGNYIPNPGQSLSEKKITAHIPGNFGIVLPGGLQVYQDPSNPLTDDQIVASVGHGTHPEEYDRIDVYVKPELRERIYDAIKKMDGIDPSKINFVDAKNKSENNPNLILDIQFKQTDKNVSEIK